ncbi:MAG: hypothetical protein IJV26_08815, partial [Lachnospiraceae bacterium]|nr:hypothetical protein [Lachnospiraceae bacterium]
MIVNMMKQSKDEVKGIIMKGNRKHYRRSHYRLWIGAISTAMVVSSMEAVCTTAAYAAEEDSPVVLEAIPEGAVEVTVGTEVSSESGSSTVVSEAAEGSSVNSAAEAGQEMAAENTAENTTENNVENTEENAAENAAENMGNASEIDVEESEEENAAQAPAGK